MQNNHIQQTGSCRWTNSPCLVCSKDPSTASCRAHADQVQPPTDVRQHEQVQLTCVCHRYLLRLSACGLFSSNTVAMRYSSGTCKIRGTAGRVCRISCAHRQAGSTGRRAKSPHHWWGCSGRVYLPTRQLHNMQVRTRQLTHEHLNTMPATQVCYVGHKSWPKQLMLTLMSLPVSSRLMKSLPLCHR